LTLGGGFNGSVVDNMILLECIYCSTNATVVNLCMINLAVFTTHKYHIGC
jgi:hypothetical protein